MYNFTEKEFDEVHSLLLRLLKTFKQVCEKDKIWYTLAYGTVLGAVRHKGFIPWDADADVCIKLEDVERFRDAFYRHQPEGVLLNDRSKVAHNTKSHDTLYFEKYPGYPDIHLDIYPLVGAPNDEKKRIKVWKRNYNLDRVFRSKYVNLDECLEENRRKVYFVKLIDKLIPDGLIKASIRKREEEYDVHTSNYLTALAAPYKPVPKCVWDRIELLPFEDDSFYVPGDWDMYLKTLYGDYMTPRKY
jgi:lipopolysaccharide cholinephosphotransferase